MNITNFLLHFLLHFLKYFLQASEIGMEIVSVLENKELLSHFKKK